MTTEIFEPNAFDFYDYDAMEKLQERHSKKYMGLLRKWYKAKENKNENAKRKAYEAIQKHQEQDEILRLESRKSGYYWY